MQVVLQDQSAQQAGCQVHECLFFGEALDAAAVGRQGALEGAALLQQEVDELVQLRADVG